MNRPQRGVFAAPLHPGEGTKVESLETLSKNRLRIMMRHAGIMVIAALAGLAATVSYFAMQPTTLKIAVGPPGSEDVRVVQAIAQQLSRDGASVRLRPIVKEGTPQSAAALDAGEADLAVVRRDVAMPNAGQAVAILRRNVAVLFVPAPQAAAKLKTVKKAASGKAKTIEKIEKIEDLAGRRIGVIGRTSANATLLNVILTQYDSPSRVEIVQIDTSDVGSAIKEHKFDAVMAVGPVNSPIIVEAIAAASRDKEAPTFLAIGASEAIAQRVPAYESTEIPVGAFGGSPPRPAESVETIGVSHYIVARKTLSEQTVGEFAKLLFGVRQSLASELPAIAKIGTPSTDKDAVVAVHPGAAAYVDGNQKNFFENYSELLLLGVMLVSFAGSAIAGIASFVKADERVRRLEVLDRLVEVVTAARIATTPKELDELRAKADQILTTTLKQVEKGGLDQDVLSAYSLGLEQARFAIADRRAVLMASAASA